MALLLEKKRLTLAAAKKIAEAAENFAAGHNWNVVIAVMDDGARLLYLARMDDALLGSVAIAQQKARTSVLFKCATKDLEAGLAGGATSLLKLDILPYEGGIPIALDGAIAGAIGVSGCTPAQDGQIAQAGVDWLRDALK
jgi:glc operon protein GlcG